MKKLLVLFSFVLLVLCSADAGENDINFVLYLNKNGTDDVWFSNVDTQTTRGSSISPVYFPLVTDGGKTDLVCNVYLYWIKQSSNNIIIKLSFVGDTTDKEYTEGTVTTKDLTGTGYMLRRVSTTKVGRNFDVTLSDKDSKTIGTVESSSTIFTAMPIGNNGDTTTTTDRSISFNPLSYTSPAKLTMTVEAENDTWEIECQYEGYVRAEVITYS